MLLYCNMAMYSWWYWGRLDD